MSSTFRVQFFNLYSQPAVFEKMKIDNIIPNGYKIITLKYLEELSTRYDVTIRTRHGQMSVFLAEQTTFLPGSTNE